MPWSVQRDGAALHVRIEKRMNDDWEQLLDEVTAQLDAQPPPAAIYIPSRVEGSSATDAEMLRLLWATLETRGVLILPPPDGV
jgi:hypothetical protein